MQIPIRSRDLDLVIIDSPQTVRQAWRLGVEPVVVRDAAAIDPFKELVLLRFDELVEVDRTVLFHTFEADPHVDLGLPIQPRFTYSRVAGKNGSGPALTGTSRPRFLCASNTFSQPITGPLSSVDPRPYSLPEPFGSGVSSNGG